MANLTLVQDAAGQAGDGTPAVHGLREPLFGDDASAGFPGDDGRLERLASVSGPRMAAALALLAACAPETFDYVLDGIEPFAGGDPGPWDDPEPYCTACGGQVGIFLRTGLDWRHFRGDGTVTSKIELLDPGHVPVVAWRLPAE